MKIGVIKEIKNEENRVALTPAGAAQLIETGHEIFIEKNAGNGSGFSDEQYSASGAKIVATATAWDQELVLKVKEPMESEYRYLKENLLFTFLHLAGVTPSLTDTLLKARTSAIAYETVEDDQKRLPLLAPMSAVAGTIAANIGANYLAEFNGGNGVLLGRIMGKRSGKVMVIGDGIVGQHAAHILESMGAKVYVFGIARSHFESMRYANPANMEFIESSPESIAQHIIDADLVIGAVLLFGARAPHLVSEEMVRSMKPGSVIVDVSIDQGGCIETSRPTSHTDPVYTTHGVIHYCVTNMPGAFPRTSTLALTDATLPYVRRLADTGLQALKDDPGFGKGLNTHQGYITCGPVSDALGYRKIYRALEELL